MLDVRRRAALLIAALFFLGLAAPLMAQTPAASARTGPGIDLIFVIDHSGSMWRHPKYPSGPNDRDGHRVGAVRETIERLAQDAEAGRDAHTISVIDYNSRVYTVLDGVELSRVGGQPGAAINRARSEAARVADRRELAHPFTDTAAAFRAALDTARKLGAASPRRQRLAILITDGRPYVDGAGNYATMLHQQRDSLRRSIADLAGLGFESWIVGINDADNYWSDARYGQPDGEFWAQATGNRARLALHAFPDIAKLVGDILDGKLGVRGTLVAGDTVEVPPFRRRAVFTVTADRPGAPLDVTDPRGRLWAANPQPDRTASRIIVPDPVPGTYRIARQTGFSYVIRLELDPPGVERVEPAGLAPLLVLSRLVLRLTGDGGGPLPVTPADVASVHLTATGPSGTPQVLPATVLPDGRIAADWTASEPGVHALALNMTMHRGGVAADLFDGAGSPPLSVEVSSKRPVFLTLDAPHPVETTSLLWPPPAVRTVFGLAGADGRAITAAEAGIVDPGTFLKMQRVDEVGAPYGPEIPAAFDGHGHWTASLPLDPAWSGGEGWWTPAAARLRVIPAGTALGRDHELDSLRLPPEAADRRVGADRWTVGPLTAAVPGWLAGLTAATLVLLLLAAFAGLLVLALPGVIVRSRDTAAGRRLQVTLHDPLADPLRARARKLAVHGRHTTRSDRNMVLEVAGTTVTLPRFRFVRDLSATRTAAGTVVYRWPSDRKSRRLRLRAGEPPRPFPGHPNSQYVIGLDQLKN